MNENATAYHHKLFPDLKSSFPETDPEFYEFWHNFMWDEVIRDTGIDDRTRFICILATLIGCQGIDEYRSMIKAAYEVGVTPVEIREIAYQLTAYAGIGRVLPFIIANNQFFKDKGISLPLEPQAVSDELTRFEAGLEIQTELFGNDMKDIRRDGNDASSVIHRWLTGNCFGDFYTRNGLSLADRELVTFSCLCAMSGVDAQLKAHIPANIKEGNHKRLLERIALSIMPFNGYPKTLNILSLIKEA